MTKEEACYIAGLLDGEGSIRLSIEKAYKGGMHVTKARVQIGLTDEPMITWLHDVTGNGYRVFRSNKHLTNNKPLYILIWSSKTCLGLLNAILPYLRIKRRQAEIVLEWTKIRLEFQHQLTGGRSGRTYPQWIIDKRDALVNECRLLNRRGK